MELTNRNNSFMKMIDEIGFISGYGNILNTVTSMSVSEKSLDLSLSLSKDILVNKDSIPMSSDDFEIIPVIVYVKREK